MAGKTPIYKIPYATSSDAINQGAIAMMNLANRVEAILSAAGIPVPASVELDEPLRGAVDDADA